MYESA